MVLDSDWRPFLALHEDLEGFMFVGLLHGLAGC